MNKNRTKTYLAAIFIAFITLMFSSCIYDGVDKCGQIGVRFDYSYNMQSTNLLANEVDIVGLYVFDKDDILIYKNISNQDSITNDYQVMINNLDPGTYRFASWATSNHLKDVGSQFKIPTLKEGVSRYSELAYYLDFEGEVHSEELNNLLVGMIKTEIANTANLQKVVVPLKKVNKRIRIVMLPYTSKTRLEVADYKCSIIDKIGSGFINADYSVIEHKPITYLPYMAKNVRAEDIDEVTSFDATNDITSASIVEFSTSRLIVENNPRLVIKSNDDDSEILAFNLPWFLSLTNMEEQKGWSLQRYLDSQDQYVITLLFDGPKWMSGTISINGWVINNIEPEL